MGASLESCLAAEGQGGRQAGYTERKVGQPALPLPTFSFPPCPIPPLPPTDHVNLVDREKEPVRQAADEGGVELAQPAQHGRFLTAWEQQGDREPGLVLIWLGAENARTPLGEPGRVACGETER